LDGTSSVPGAATAKHSTDMSTGTISRAKQYDLVIGVVDAQSTQSSWTVALNGTSPNSVVSQIVDASANPNGMGAYVIDSGIGATGFVFTAASGGNYSASAAAFASN